MACVKRYNNKTIVGLDIKKKKNHIIPCLDILNPSGSNRDHILPRAPFAFLPFITYDMQG